MREPHKQMSDGDFRMELMKRGWVPPFEDVSALLADIVPDAKLVIEVKAGFEYIRPPQSVEEAVRRLSFNVDTMRVATRMEPLIRELITKGLIADAERAKEGE